MPPFLTARWTHLALFNFAVDPAFLAPHLPPGCTLDEREGWAFVSLVGFDFEDTKVLGVPWPGYRRFPEINLRFYVRQGGDRGVAFVREFVPSRLVAGLARRLYNEPYRARPMRSEVVKDGAGVRVCHRVAHANGESSFTVWAEGPPAVPPEDGVAHFFKEHRYGYGRTRAGAAMRYVVEHPVWAVYRVREFSLKWDFARLYGEAWAPLNDTAPHSVMLAEGSKIAVYPKT